MTRRQRKLKTVRDAMIESNEMQPDLNPVEAHWKCPDCELHCYCTGISRLHPHERCGWANGHDL